jgi:hypothetical protein
MTEVIIAEDRARELADACQDALNIAHSTAECKEHAISEIAAVAIKFANERLEAVAREIWNWDGIIEGAADLCAHIRAMKIKEEE